MISLLEKKCRGYCAVGARDEIGDTPLHAAVQLLVPPYRRMLDETENVWGDRTIQPLLCKGADPNAGGRVGTPLQCCLL